MAALEDPAFPLPGPHPSFVSVLSHPPSLPPSRTLKMRCEGLDRITSHVQAKDGEGKDESPQLTPYHLLARIMRERDTESLFSPQK